MIARAAREATQGTTPNPMDARYEPENARRLRIGVKPSIFSKNYISSWEITDINSFQITIPVVQLPCPNRNIIVHKSFFHYKVTVMITIKLPKALCLASLVITLC